MSFIFCCLPRVTSLAAHSLQLCFFRPFQPFPTCTEASAIPSNAKDIQITQIPPICKRVLNEHKIQMIFNFTNICLLMSDLQVLNRALCCAGFSQCSSSLLLRTGWLLLSSVWRPVRRLCLICLLAPIVLPLSSPSLNSISEKLGLDHCHCLANESPLFTLHDSIPK